MQPSPSPCAFFCPRPNLATRPAHGSSACAQHAFSTAHALRVLAWTSPNSACCVAVGSWPPLARARARATRGRCRVGSRPPDVWDYQMTSIVHLKSGIVPVVYGTVPYWYRTALPVRCTVNHRQYGTVRYGTEFSGAIPSFSKM